MCKAECSSKLYKYALEECIKQFDYSNDKNWRLDFENMMLEFAQQRIDREHQNQQQKLDHND